MNKNWRAKTNIFLRGLNISWSRNKKLQPCLPGCLSIGIRCNAVGFLPFQQAHSWPFGTQRTLQQICYFLPTKSAVPVEFYDHNESVMRAAGICSQRTFCSKPRGITLIESTQSRWFSRWSGWGGWSSRAVAQRRPRVSKLGLKGTANYHSKEIAVKTARPGVSRPN